MGDDATDRRSAPRSGSDEETRAQLAPFVESLKEYVLGTAVVDRGDSFDPRTDTIVRVQARRLGARLKGE